MNDAKTSDIAKTSGDAKHLTSSFIPQAGAATGEVLQEADLYVAAKIQVTIRN
jgi:hypothetical protein